MVVGRPCPELARRSAASSSDATVLMETGCRLPIYVLRVREGGLVAKLSKVSETIEYRIGTASWTDPTLVNSDLFYPPSVRSAEERLRFYAEQFNTVEVDSTYYALPAERNAGDSAQFCGECSTSRTR